MPLSITKVYSPFMRIMTKRKRQWDVHWGYSNVCLNIMISTQTTAIEFVVAANLFTVVHVVELKSPLDVTFRNAHLLHEMKWENYFNFLLSPRSQTVFNGLLRLLIPSWKTASIRLKTMPTQRNHNHWGQPMDISNIASYLNVIELIQHTKKQTGIIGNALGMFRMIL